MLSTFCTVKTKKFIAASFMDKGDAPGAVPNRLNYLTLLTEISAFSAYE